MRYTKRYNRFTFQTNCRVCLTQSVAKMIPLGAPLKGALMPKPLVHEAMEFVMSEKIDLSEVYPQGLCAVCVELLKISYDLKLQYRESRKKLKEQLRDLSDIVKVDSKIEEDKTSVDILVGSQRFNIDDIFIVEDDSQDEELFQGFLNNLGKSISASFVEKGYKKPKPILEIPSLVIEKISPDAKINENEDGKEVYEESSAEDKVKESNKNIANDEENENIVGNEEEENIARNEEEENMARNEEEENIAPLSDDEADVIFFNAAANEDMMNVFMTNSENDRELLESARKLKYKCPFCERPMASLKRVKLHTSGACKKNKLNSRCYVCRTDYKNRKELLGHLRNEHLMKVKNQVPNDGIEHKCHLCGKILKSHGNLSYHLSKHVGKRYSCDICDKSFYTRSQTKNHRQTHNRNDTLVVCPVCGKGFHYRNGLFYHMKIHTNERNLSCSYCPRRFYTRNSVKRHELTHTGARPYDCSYCDKAFRSHGEAKKHMLLHTGERPFKCKYCELGFTQLHNLKVHLMTHPGDFQCIYCAKGFLEKDTLRFHVRTKHGEGKQVQNVIQNEDYSEEVEHLEQEEQGHEDEMEEEEDIEGQAEAIPEGDYFYAEEYVDNAEEYVDNEQSIVSTYEVADEVLVETVQEDL